MRTFICKKGQPPVEVALFIDQRRDWCCWVSRDARFFSCREGNREYKNIHKDTGYMRLTEGRRINGKAKHYNYCVHRVVLTAWCGQPPAPHYQCDHIDGNRLNNHITNLRWLTPAENHALRRKQVCCNYTIKVYDRRSNQLLDTVYRPGKNKWWGASTATTLYTLKPCIAHTLFTRRYRLEVTKLPKSKIIDL